MFKSALIALTALAFVGTASAADNGIVLSKDRKTTIATHGSSQYNPASEPAHTPSNTFSNVGWKYPNGLYFCCYGNTISGSGSAVGQTFWLAASFSPAQDATAKEIDAGVGWVEGTNKVIITLYDDNGGVPGSVLASGAADSLGVFGDCCGLATLKLRGGVALTGGATYWVSVTTDGADSDTWAAWNLNSTDQVNPVTIAVSNGGDWTNLGGSIPAPSFAVLTKKHN